MITVTLYSRADCHLCDIAKDDLAALQDEFPHQLVEIDIDSDDGLVAEFGEKIPVIEVGPYRKAAPFNQQDLRITLMAARDRINQLEKIGDKGYKRSKARSRTITRTDKFSLWFSSHYTLVFNFLVVIYLGVPFLAPVLMNAGITGPARLIYRAYSTVCHQFAYRSWFLFGDQPAYPRTAAEVAALVPYGEATGMDEADPFAARAYIGNEQVGYKVAFCERDVAIYGGILVFGLIFAATGRRLPSLPWYFWVLLGMVPIGLDGFSQLLSQPPFSFWEYRESTPLLRSLTGGLFGFATAWFGYPMVEEGMRDTRRILRLKIERLQKMRSDSSKND